MAKIYEAMQKGSGATRTEWDFFDLENRKQIGDLDKKIIQYNRKETKNCKIFNITSCRGKEGVTTVFTNLINYFNLQHPEKHLLVIDANLQHPQLHNVFKLENEQGLVDCFTDLEQFPIVIRSLEPKNITVLTSGKNYKRHADNLSQEKFASLLMSCKNKYDYIFIDSPPILSSSDGISTAVASDVTFLVLQALKVQQEVVLKAKTYLQDNECVIGGVVLNRLQQVIPEWMYRII